MESSEEIKYTGLRLSGSVQQLNLKHQYFTFDVAHFELLTTFECLC
uniref:Uncharacterized protein n=1 Tax=Rhizophora mucronata TaxID=61149 RepID=A0A2P2NM53_RHIMU